MKEKPKCKYCGGIVKYEDVCYHCHEKLKLWRTIHKMVSNMKKREERGKSGESKN